MRCFCWLNEANSNGSFAHFPWRLFPWFSHMIHHLHQDLLLKVSRELFDVKSEKKNKRILENMSPTRNLPWPHRKVDLSVAKSEKVEDLHFWKQCTGDERWQLTTISDGWFRIAVLTKLEQGGREREREVGEIWSAIHPDERGNFCEFLCFEIDFKLIGTGSYWHPPTICFGKLKKSNRICCGVGKLWKKLHWT